MSFKGIRKSIRTMKAPTSTADASPHLSNEFPAGYSLTRYSPAALVSASPAGVNDASSMVQIGGVLSTIETVNHNSTGSESTLRGQFFCPKNGEYLNVLYLVIEMLMSQGAVADSFRHLFGLPVPREAVHSMKTRGSEYYSATYQNICQRIASGRLVHADET